MARCDCNQAGWKKNSVLGRCSGVEMSWFYHLPRTDYMFYLLPKASDCEYILYFKIDNFFYFSCLLSSFFRCLLLSGRSCRCFRMMSTNTNMSEFHYNLVNENRTKEFPG